MGLLIMILALSIVVAIHEFGHFLVAKKKGLLVTDFSIGFGPTLFKKTKGETTYSLKLILFGGYVMMADRDIEKFADTEIERTYQGLKPLWKAILSLAGPMFNFVLAFLLFIPVMMIQGKAELIEESVIYTVEGTSMHTAGFESGDTITAMKKDVDTEWITVTYYDDITNNITTWSNDEDGIYFRADDGLEANVEKDSEGKYGFGQNAKYTKPESFGEVISYTWSSMVAASTAIFSAFAGIFTGSTSMSELGGPVAIIASGSTVLAMGAVTFIKYIAFLSVNFFVLNLIPIPPFDGSKIAFAGYEAVAKKEPNKKFVNAITTGGVLLLLGFFLFITLQDIGNLFG